MTETSEIPEGYKATEVGVLPEEWEIITLEQCNQKRKITINPANFPDEVFEYFSIPAYQNSKKAEYVKGSTILSQKLILQNNSVLFGKLNPRVEKIWEVKSDSSFRKIGSTEWLEIFPDPDFIDPDFLFFIEWSDFVLPLSKSLVSGSTPSRQRVDPDAFYKIKIPLPPLPEQRAIAYVLRTVQEAKEKTDAVIAATKALKAAMMKHLFTYGPVPPEDAEKVVLKETEIGQVPAGWEVTKFSEVVDIAKGQIDPTNEPYNKLLHIGPENIVSGTGQVIGMKTAKEINLISGQFYFTSENVIYSKIRPYLKKVAFPKIEGTCSADMYPLKPKEARLFPEFLFQYLLSGQFSDDAISFQDRTGIPKINRQQIGLIHLPIPPITIQKKIATILSTIDQKFAAEQSRRQALDALFTTLLHDLMTAKIRVNKIPV